jgi:hypothetical protein
MLLNNRNTIPAVREDTCLAVHSSCEELLDDSRCLYYLENLPECRMNIAKGLSLLRSLERMRKKYTSRSLCEAGASCAPVLIRP